MPTFKKVRLGAAIDVYQEIQEINEDIFNGELDTPILEIEHDNDFDGFMYFYEGMYYIGIALDQVSYEKAICTLLHEMVHQWQHQRGMTRMQHDTTFNRKCVAIEKFYGYPPKAVQGTNNINIMSAA